MNPILTRATAEDVDEYIRIAKDTASPYNLTITDPAEALEEIRTSVVQMVRLEGRVVGVVTYIQKFDTCVYIAELGIHSSMRGRSLGGKVLEMVVDDLRARGVKMVDLVTHPDGDALRFYERHGFVVEKGVTIQNYQGSGTPRVCLTRRL